MSRGRKTDKARKRCEKGEMQNPREEERGWIQSPGQDVALQGRGKLISSGVTGWGREPKGTMQWGYSFGLGDEVAPIQWLKNGKGGE